MLLREQAKKRNISLGHLLLFRCTFVQRKEKLATFCNSDICHSYWILNIYVQLYGMSFFIIEIKGPEMKTNRILVKSNVFTLGQAQLCVLIMLSYNKIKVYVPEVDLCRLRDSLRTICNDKVSRGDENKFTKTFRLLHIFTKS